MGLLEIRVGLFLLCFEQLCDQDGNLFCLLPLTVSEGTWLGEIDWYLRLSHFLAEWLGFLPNDVTFVLQMM